VAVQLFTGNTIAVIWDFDQTLIPGYQQDPLFSEYGIDGRAFWDEVNALEEYYKAQELVVSPDTVYLNHLLTYVESGALAGLTNARLRELGGKIEFYPGMPDFMRSAKLEIESNERYAAHDIVVEHYVVSTGLRQMILGSAVADEVKGVWGCEFIEQPARPGFLESGGLARDSSEIRQVGYFLDNTTKTRAIWEINKGTNVDSDIGVNDTIANDDRRVPIPNMLYVADGPSDIPVFSILNEYGGRTLGVYNPGQPKHFANVKALNDQGRVQAFAPADYTIGSQAALWIAGSLREMADRIVENRSRAIADRVGHSAGHVNA